MKEKKERDKEIKLEIMANSGLKELKEEIQALKVGIGAKKSEINVKINKIDKEIKSIKENCKKQGQGNAEGLIVELR